MKPKKPKESYRDRLRRFLASSDMRVMPYFDPFDPSKLTALAITLDGDAAKVPSMKNSKLPGKNFINPEAKARVVGLTTLYRDKASHISARFGKEPVFLVVIHGDRKTAYDADNALTTIRDWLEPSTKEKGGTTTQRGWGIGVLDDDRFCVGAMSLQWSQLGRKDNRTQIIIMRRHLADSAVRRFVEQVKGGICESLVATL